MNKRMHISICVIAIIITTVSGIWKTDMFKAEMDRDGEKLSDYIVEENRFIIEMENINIDISYPKILLYDSDSSQSGFSDDESKQSKIDKILTPSEIEKFSEMITDGFIKTSGSGEFVYDSSLYTYPNVYNLGMSGSYSMGFMNNNFFNIYKRSINCTRNSDWNYGAILIDMTTGTQIMSYDFFDVAKFREHLENGLFETDKKDFDIKSYFSNISEDQLLQCLRNAFINQNEQIEVIVIYGEGPETIIYADINKAVSMIKPQYADHFKY